MKLKSLFLFLLLFGLRLVVSAQNDTTFFNRTANSLSNYYEKHPIEKVYLHLDKPFYLSNDTIWFKAYTVVGAQHRLSALSKVLYCELINDKDSVINRHVLKLISGVAWGDFILPRTLTPGNYRIRAYTKWMQNAGADYFYNQTIRIGGQKPASTTLTTTPVKPDIQFFPEGGELVNGIRSKVAVKLVKQNGLGIDATGVITDNEGNEVAAFTTQHLGMGLFALMPQSGKIYKAKIICADSARYTVDVPTAQEKGFVLSVNNNRADSLIVRVQVNQKLFQEKQNSIVYLVAQSGGNISYTIKSKLTGPGFTTRIAKNIFSTGITQFTLFSESCEPLNERIVFIQNNDDLKFKSSAIAQTYLPRQKMKIDLDIKNKLEKPTVGSFSVAVINETQVPVNENMESTILSNLLLTSDIKGYIEQPNYYFNHVNEQTIANLDILMLTQGYHRFEWKQVLNNTSPPIAYQPEKGIELQGSIKTLSGKIVTNGKIAIMCVKEGVIIDTLTDATGNFKIGDLNFSDTAKLVLSAKKNKSNPNVIIDVIPTKYPVITKQQNIDILNTFSTEGINVLQKNYLTYLGYLKDDSLKKARMLKEVVIKAKKSQKPDLSHSANLHGGGNADQVILADKLNNCANLSDCLRGIVFGVNFAFDGTPISTRGGKMSVIIDGVILDGNQINNLNASDIYSIEVLRTGFTKGIYGSTIQPGGALVITTKRGVDPTYVSKEPPVGIISYSYKGYYKAKTFYTPQYTHPKTDAEALDLRNTIYWNPNMVTNQQGNASFEYYNNDSKGTYRVVIEGVDVDGNLGRQVYRYKVE